MGIRGEFDVVPFDVAGILNLGCRVVEDGVRAVRCRRVAEEVVPAADLLVGLQIQLECVFNGEEVDLEGLRAFRDRLHEAMKQVTARRDALHEQERDEDEDEDEEEEARRRTSYAIAIEDGMGQE